MTLGFLGLGKMGSRMAKKLAAEGHDVRVWNRTFVVAQKLAQEVAGIQACFSIKELVVALPTPRVVWLMLPVGEATDSVISEVARHVNSGDIIIDSGNANFHDSERRFSELSKKGIRFLGIGVSGGIVAEESGYPLMVGGDKSAYEVALPILDSLAKPRGGHTYFGTSGAGHFVKMVHNGIEYGIMQSLGEGFEVLEKSPYKLDLVAVAKLWQKGTLVSGFMLDRAVEALLPDPTLKKVVGVVAQSGEAKWTVEQAKKEGVAVEIIERSLVFRTRSQTDLSIQLSFTAKLIAALRTAFGGHEVQKSSK